MSLIAAALGWTGLPRWAMEALAILAISGGVLTAYGIWHHRIYQEGIAAQRAADDRASSKTLADAQRRDAQLMKAQRDSNAALESKYAMLQSSNQALASTVADSLRDAYREGRQSAVSAAPPSASVGPAAPAGDDRPAQAVPDTAEVFAACAQDDAKLTVLQLWVQNELKLFNTTEVH